jgi:hypothetical protein
MPNKFTEKFGGAWWDTLFIFVKDNDKDFIYQFVDRIPCDDCREKFFTHFDNYDFNVDKNQIRKILWEIRTKIHTSKYEEKNDDKHLNEYLEFLLIKDK